MQFEFSTASRIIFGSGKLDLLGDFVGELGKQVFIVSGCPREISDRLTNLLETQGITYSFVKVKPEPTIDLVQELVDLCQRSKSEVVIGIGGGTAIDTAKATAALVTNPGNITNYLEVIGENQPFSRPSLPLIAVPTTAGTGSEVTRNAVLGSSTHHIKVSLRSRYLLPRIALVDPDLSLSVPPSITAYSGLDTLTQLIEPFTCNTTNPLTDALCKEGIQRVGRSIYQAFNQGSELSARQDMSLASLFSGLALANARLGAVHGLAGPLGGELSAPHGVICACLLPHVMQTNLSALVKQNPDHPSVERYKVSAELLIGDPSATADEGIQWVGDFCKHARIPQLSTFGLSESMFDKLIEKSIKASSMKGNPVTLSELEMRNILQMCL